MTVQLGADRTAESTPLPARLGAGLVVALALVLGIFVLGRFAPTEPVAMAMTTVWFGLVAGLVWVAWRRRRDLLGSLLVGYLIVAVPVGVWLGLPQVTDRTVSEDVVIGVREDQAASRDAVLLGQGGFASQAHPTTGTASMVRLANGQHRVTLTGFETDNGPDLRVYLLPSDTESVDRAIDLGALKGNIGDQEYAVPAGVDPATYDRVVIWCRAFAVSFGTATLTFA